MAHGTEDWGVTSGLKTTYKLSDMGELAVRLGSIVSFDRRGDVVVLDDFEASTLKWHTIRVGTGAAAALSTTAARNGSQSLKLTMGDAENDTTYAYRYAPNPVLGKIGGEYSFSLGADLKLLTHTLLLRDGAYQHDPYIIYYPQDNILGYHDSDGGITELTDSLDLYEYPFFFNTWKLVVDFKKEEYVRAIVNEVEYDLSGISYKKTVSATTPLFRLALAVVNNSAGNHHVYVDDVIITQNEP